MSIIERPIEALPSIPTAPEKEAERREVLLRAADIVERRGWGKGWMYQESTGRVCLLGAVGMAIYGEDEFIRRYKGDVNKNGALMSLQAAEFLDIGDDVDYVWTWNDGLSTHVGPTLVPDTLRKMANGKSFGEVTGWTPEAFDL